MRTPAATYRLQMGNGLGFEEAAALVPYVDALGADTLYLSPVFASAGGGGYHVTDPTRLDPGLGGEEGFARLVAACRERGMGVVLDIVPNHLAATEESPWWADVLARGRESAYASWFDVDWSRHGGKVLLPVLAEPGAREEGEHVVRAYWRDGLRELNYRRFFDIGDLVSLRQEDPEVFAATHELVLRLVREGAVSGLRVDHVDGLRDPGGYLSRLREAAGDAFVVVEKILARDEDLPADWPVDGTTGYEAADAITGVLSDPEGAAECDLIAARFTGDPAPFAEVVRESKRQVLRELFAGEVRRLAEDLGALPGAPELALESLETAVMEVTACLGVYRTFARDGGPSGEDRGRIEEALDDAGTAVAPDALALVRRVLLASDPGPAEAGWVQRWQLLTGPAMAKGFEDTALYRHMALVSRNEVGGEPGQPPVGPAEFHRAMTARQTRWPGSLTATSTHDTKRSEDARTRIAVLSELSEEWERHLEAWNKLLPTRDVGDHTVPTPSERLLLFQTILGVWPVDSEPGEEFTGRVQDAMVKSAREAKLRTSWLDPDEDHEQALRDAVAELIADPRFREAFSPFAERVALHGAVNSLAQVVLRTTVPGVPDLYRGAEAWFTKLVDPDNRAPVDFVALRETLDELDERAGELPGLADELRASWPDGRIKLHVTATALRFRRERADLFREGDYVPLEPTGARADRVLAFARRLGDDWAIVVVPRLTASLSEGWPLAEVWGDTAVRLPGGAPSGWTDALTRGTVEAGGGMIPVAGLLRRLPVALLGPS